MRVWRWFLAGIAALAAAGFLWVAPANFPALAAAPDQRAARVDPGVAAREVLQDQDFWWKRIEQRSVTIPTTGIQAFFAWLLDLPLQILRWVFLAIRDFINWLRWNVLSLFTSDLSAASILVKLIAVAIIAWAIWKLYPHFVRWISAIAATPGAETAGSASWQTLEEPSDLFAQAGEAFADAKYADAIRLALLALIARLQKQGLIRYDTTRTNHEYQRELRHMKDVAASFGQLARIYERVWYGRFSAGRAEAEVAISLCRSLIHREDLAPE